MSSIWSQCLGWISIMVLIAAVIGRGEDPNEKQRRINKCVKECERTIENTNQEKSGKYLCNPDYPNEPPLSLCEWGCHRYRAPDDAALQKCFCDHCKIHKGIGFCGLRPDGWGPTGWIKLEECETTVCQGSEGDNHIKYRGDRCGFPGSENEDRGPAPPGYDSVYRE